MPAEKLKVAVAGAGRWSERAHIPGWLRDPRVELAALVDVNRSVAEKMAADFGIPNATDNIHEVLDDPSFDVLDVATGNDAHFELSMAALEAGKHVLCEKPVNHDARETGRAAALAATQGVKTKLGFTFRYAPAIQYAKDLIDQGFVGEPYVFNGYEQNSQWIDPETPLRQAEEPTVEGQIRGLFHRGLRRADHRHHALVGRQSDDRGRRHDAQLRARACCARDRQAPAHEHRRR